MRRIFANTLIIAMAVALLWHLSCIWHWGRVIIQEPSKVILVSEVGLLTGILGFGIYCLGKDYKAPK